MITTNDAGFADRLRLLRNQGMRSRYQYEIAGHNYRMTDLQAAIAIPQLARLTAINEARRRNAAYFTDQLKDVDGLIAPEVPPGREHVFHQYTVRVTADAPVDRDAFVDRLAQLGVGSGIYYPKLMGDYACYRDHPQVQLDETPHAAQIAQEVVSLPVHPQLSESDRDRIVSAVHEAMS